MPSVAAGTALLYEIVLTAFLMFVITAVATDTRAVGAAAAIAIGGTVGARRAVRRPVTGASMNPARSFGPALAAGQWSDFWIYVVGPVVGAAIGVLAYELVRGLGTGAKRIDELEHEADRTLRSALSSLFDRETDALLVCVGRTF